MAEKKTVDIDALIARGTPITDAIRRGAHEAMKRHIQAGVPMVSQKNGQMTMLSPEELQQMLTPLTPQEK